MDPRVFEDILEREGIEPEVLNRRQIESRVKKFLLRPPKNRPEFRPRLSRLQREKMRELSGVYRTVARFERVRFERGRIRVLDPGTGRFTSRGVDVLKGDRVRFGWGGAVVLRDPGTGRIRSWVRLE